MWRRGCRDTGAGDRPARRHPCPVAADHRSFTRAFAAAAEGDWARRWRWATRAKTASPASSAMALCAGPQQRRQIRRDRCGDPAWRPTGPAAPRSMHGPKPPSPATCHRTPILSWFDGRTPASPIGCIRLGEALVASGDSQRARSDPPGLGEGSFDEFTENDILAHGRRVPHAGKRPGAAGRAALAG